MRWKKIIVAFGCPYRRQQAQRSANITPQKNTKVKSKIELGSWSSNRHLESQSIENPLLPHQQIHPNKQQISQWKNREISYCQSQLRTQQLSRKNKSQVSCCRSFQTIVKSAQEAVWVVAFKAYFWWREGQIDRAGQFYLLKVALPASEKVRKHQPGSSIIGLGLIVMEHWKRRRWRPANLRRKEKEQVGKRERKIALPILRNGIVTSLTIGRQRQQRLRWQRWWRQLL